MTDASILVTHEIVRAIGNLDDDTPIARQAWLLLGRLRLILQRDDVLEIMAMAADAEEAAQKGEPSPWREDIGGNDEEWKAERRCAMLCALKAVGLA